MASRDIEILAAEYALGLLQGEDLAHAEQRRAKDGEFAVAIASWESMLSPLGEAAASIPAPAGLLARIEQALDAGQSPEDTRSTVLATHIEALQRSLAAWRMAAIGAAAAAAAIALAWFGGMDMPLRPYGPPDRYVAMLQSDAGQTGFVVTLDMKDKSCAIRSMAPGLPSSKAYEMWAMMKDDKPPMSLGVVGGGAYEKMSMPLALDTAELEKVGKIAISLEQPGGSPGKQPTGPVVFAGELIKMTP